MFLEQDRNLIKKTYLDVVGQLWLMTRKMTVCFCDVRVLNHKFSVFWIISEEQKFLSFRERERERVILMVRQIIGDWTYTSSLKYFTGSSILTLFPFPCHFLTFIWLLSRTCLDSVLKLSLGSVWFVGTEIWKSSFNFLKMLIPKREIWFNTESIGRLYFSRRDSSLPNSYGCESYWKVVNSFFLNSKKEFY